VATFSGNSSSPRVALSAVRSLSGESGRLFLLLSRPRDPLTRQADSCIVAGQSVTLHTNVVTRLAHQLHEGMPIQRDDVLFKLLEFYGTRLHHRGQWWVHRHLRRLLGADIDAECHVVRNGRRFVLNPGDFVQRDFFWFGEQDRMEPRVLARLLTSGSVLFDVGANFGYYAITLADALGQDCRVFAFEPFPSTYSHLRRHIELNALDDVIRAYPVALADKAGFARMAMDNRNSGAAALSDSDGIERVEVSTLDNFCAAHAIDRLDLLKVDVEGYEERLLIGGAETIARLSPLIFIELNPPALARAGSTVDRVVARLREHGYELFVAQRDRLEPLQQLPRGGNYVNAFCLHPSRHSTSRAKLRSAAAQ
jgi:FkbM family methyltransferase